MWTVHELSEISGVTARALRHYDAVGLLKPTEVSAAGYRLYDDTALERLQQILLFRELEFSFKEIKTILESPGFDRNRALEQQIPVVDKLVTVVGEVEHPLTVRVPLGASIGDVVSLAGEITVKDPAYLVGGPMMGNLAEETALVTKTTNAVIVLDKSHTLVRRKDRNAAIDLKRAASCCCQCETCTSLCPRHALGHPIEPHRFMRSAANQDFQDTQVFVNTLACSSCGLCENFSCPQGLSPRSLIADYKGGLRKAGVKLPPDTAPDPVKKGREYRRVPEERLKARLGLARYDVEAPLQPESFWRQGDRIQKVKILLSQHIGAPAVPVVEKGARVQRGECIGAPAEGLSVGIHASLDGVVQEVTDRYITVAAVGSPMT